MEEQVKPKPEPQVILRTSDNTELETDMEIAMISGTLKVMYEVLPSLDDRREIPLFNVDSTTMKKVIHWCTYHKNDPSAASVDDTIVRKTDDICPWDVEFLKVDMNMLYKLAEAANFLEIPGLMNVICKTIANMIKGKSVEEVRKIFNIQNDYTPEEEAKLRNTSGLD